MSDCPPPSPRPALLRVSSVIFFPFPFPLPAPCSLPPAPCSLLPTPCRLLRTDCELLLFFACETVCCPLRAACFLPTAHTCDCVLSASSCLLAPCCAHLRLRAVRFELLAFPIPAESSCGAILWFRFPNLWPQVCPNEIISPFTNAVRSPCTNEVRSTRVNEVGTNCSWRHRSHAVGKDMAWAAAEGAAYTDDGADIGAGTDTGLCPRCAIGKLSALSFYLPVWVNPFLPVAGFMTSPLCNGCDPFTFSGSKNIEACRDTDFGFDHNCCAVGRAGVKCASGYYVANMVVDGDNCGRFGGLSFDCYDGACRFASPASLSFSLTLYLCLSISLSFSLC